MKISRTLILIGTMLSVSIIGLSQERIITKISWKKEPVKIVKIRTKDRDIELGKRFTEGEDWLRGLTVTVENTSNKPISRIVLNLSFPRPKDTSEEIPTLSISMMYGLDPSDVNAQSNKVIFPGEKADVALLEANLPFIRNSLKELNYPKTIIRASIMVQSVTFNDGTMWMGDDILIPHPDNPKQKIYPMLPLPEIKKPPEPSAVFCDKAISFFKYESPVFTQLPLLNYDISIDRYDAEESVLPCNVRYLGSLTPECSTPGSGCTRLQNLFDDSIYNLRRRNSRRTLEVVFCQKTMGQCAVRHLLATLQDPHATS